MSCKCSCSFCEELLALKKKYDTDLERARNQVREQYLRLCDLYPALLTMMRAIENGHPIGHDAVLQARRALKRAHLGAVPKTNPDYSCYCTVCAKKRKVAKP